MGSLGLARNIIENEELMPASCDLRGNWRAGAKGATAGSACRRASHCGSVPATQVAFTGEEQSGYAQDH